MDTLYNRLFLKQICAQAEDCKEPSEFTQFWLFCTTVYNTF